MRRPSFLTAVVAMTAAAVTAPVAFGQGTVFMVAQGGAGNQIDVSPGASVTLDVFVRDLSPSQLSAYQWSLPIAVAPQPGGSGSVDFSGALPVVDTARTDFVFLGLGPFVSPFAASAAGVIVFFLNPPSQFPVVTTAKYVGEITYNVSAGAQGSFVIEFIDPGVSQNSQTVFADQTQAGIPIVGEPFTIRVPCTTNADCDDGLFCNGSETCVAGDCTAGTPPCPLPGLPFCDDALDSCVACLTPADCDDGNECTTNACTNGLCSNPPLALGTPCGDPTDVECNGADTCNGSGSCRNNLDPDGTPCADEGNDCTVDFCLGGVCAHPLLPAGTACGDPSDTDCDNPDSCDASGVCQPNVEPSGLACGDPTDTDCNGADTCDGAGACNANVQPDGAACTSDLNDCTADLCNAGVCIHPNEPMGTACGDPSDTECDNPDSCDGAGFCLPNPEIAGFPCGDPSSTDCTNPDTCDGGGLCAPNNAPDGITCDDGQFCTSGESCLAGVCGNGAATDCSDGLPCTDDVCDDVGDTCLNPILPGNCLIAGMCFNAGDANPMNECGVCDPAQDAANWSQVPDGTACTDDGNTCTDDACQAGACLHPNLPTGATCDDGNPCTGTGNPGVGVDECDGLGNCSGLLDPECADDCVNAVQAFEGVNLGTNVGFGPDDAEASCQPNSNHDAWFVFTANCSGNIQITTDGSAFLPSNDTVLSVFNACGGTEIACDDDSGTELLSSLIVFNATAGMDYFVRVAGFGQNVGDIQLNITRLDTCFIGGVCISPGTQNPANECQICDPAADNADWSAKPVGTTCGDPGFGECDSADACNAVGVCESNNKPDGTACTADANECTDDICLSGVCAHPDRPAGFACGDPTDTECDNPDTCDGAGTCLDNLEPVGFACGDPTDTDCDNPDTCDGAGACLINLEPDGLVCTQDGNDCTDDFCQTGVCVHPDRPAGFACGDPTDTDCDNPDTCDGAGTCLDNLEAVGFACGDPTDTDCDNPDTCDGVGTCLINLEPDATPCTDDLNECTADFCQSGVCAHPNEPPGTACGSPTDTECDNPDTCDGLGSCQSNLEPFGFACGDATNTDCNNPDTCDGTGACQPNLESDGTACTDDANECTDDICSTGFCVHPNRPAGFACGDPTDTQCDNPDTCDGFGFCESNLEADGTPCDDVNVCTGPDLCIAGVCDTPFIPDTPIVTPNGPRSIMVTAQPTGSLIEQALRVTSPDHPCLLEWVGMDGVLTGAPVFRTAVDWGTVEVTGFALTPGAQYDVVAECGGDFSGVGSAVTAPWGDVNNDGAVSIFDLFCMLDGFQAIFDVCPKSAIDLQPCVPDGVINVFDLFAILDALNALEYPCVGPCGGGACCNGTVCTIADNAAACTTGGGVYQGDGVNCDAGVCTVSVAGAGETPDDSVVAVTPVIRKGRITAGGTVFVDLFADNLNTIRGYEVAVDVFGGDRGSITFTRAFVDAGRSDYVFRGSDGQTFDAVDSLNQRYVNVKTGAAESASGRVYLGTFEFQASRDAAGSFDVVLRGRGGTLLLDAAGRAVTLQTESTRLVVGAIRDISRDRVGRGR